MSVRIDPIKPNGLFDSERYDQEDYSLLRESVLKYVNLEGFDTVPGEYHLHLSGLDWYIKVQ